MDSSLTRARPRARNSRTESLLREIERGSLTHLNRLSGPTGWPNDLHDGSLSLRVLFGVLEKEPVPPSDPAVNLSAERPTEAVNRCRLVLAIIGDPVIKALPGNALLLNVFKENEATLLRWLAFVSHESSWVYQDLHSSYESETFGPMLAADVLYSISKRTYDRSKILDISPYFVDLLLYLWNWRDSGGSSLSSAYSRRETCPLTSLFAMATKAPDAHHTLEEIFSAFSTKHHCHFIQSSARRLNEWISSGDQGANLQVSHTWPLKIIDITQRFINLPTYVDAYVKRQFPKNTWYASRRLSHILARPPLGAEELPFPVVVSIRFFPLNASVAPMKLVRGTMPGLLKAGLLNILIDHLISQPHDTPYPWYAWTGEEDAGHPINVLASLCVDAELAQKTAAAMEEIGPMRQRRLMMGPWCDEHWVPFRKTFDLFYGMWSNTMRISLCDNMNHSEKVPTVRPTTTECQREDWEAFHRNECAGNHQYRREREIASSWTSHLERQFYMKVLRHAVLNVETGLPIEVVDELWPDDDTTPAIEHPHAPLTASRQAKIERTKDAIIQINTLPCPPKTLLLPLEKVLNFSHGGGPTFQDPRYLAMFHELQESMTGTEAAREPGRSRQRIRLAMCIGHRGEYRVYAFGRFVVTKWVGKTKVEALNLFVKVVERSKVADQGAGSLE
ncbi:hypothetical protein FA13DRAFT_1814187 [Coprinellus micaceus]|uniref:Uncharacterized protein n=1 Tax=Coprinellus micaceus TaxID=71717 RepID=A0A4Y7TB48_COPMI|nr:hypothetical protein FA13DRAFT_1814187 [Coprinellus micaceus]